MHTSLFNTFLVLCLFITNLIAGSFNHPVSEKINTIARSSVTNLLSPTAPLVFKRLASKNPRAFYQLFTSMFGFIPMLSESADILHLSSYIHRPDSKDVFFSINEPKNEEDNMTLIGSGAVPYAEDKDGTIRLAPVCLYERSDSSKKKPKETLFSTEIHVTKEDFWSDISRFPIAPRSDSEFNTIVYNLVANPENTSDRTIIFGSQNKSESFPKILRVTQLGLGAKRIKESTNPETKAWLDFLTTAHTSLIPPTNTLDIVASAYPALKKKRNDVFMPVSAHKLEGARILVDFFNSGGFPLAAMIRQTGLSKTEVLKIIQDQSR